MKTNLVPGFFARITIKFIDFLFVFIFSSLFIFLIVDFVNDELIIKNKIWYFIWIFFTISLFAIWFWIIPLLTNGFTLGSYIFKVKLISLTNKNITIVEILKNEMFFSVAWVLTILIGAFFIDEVLLVKLSQNNLANNNLTTIEEFFVAIPATIGTTVALSNIFILLSSTFNEKKLTVVEKYINVNKIYVKKYQEKSKLIKETFLEPETYKQNEINFIN